ncbi:unnamed protein product [Gordionus sp. m RMFG-2023]|uniref:uncharacterized protein LOC135922115 n=1 Tax=Gordionus sp. m RMFG-2023 TaxID=3053472 RepID=UPI0030DFF2E3
MDPVTIGAAAMAVAAVAGWYSSCRSVSAAETSNRKSLVNLEIKKKQGEEAKTKADALKVDIEEVKKNNTEAAKNYENLKNDYTKLIKDNEQFKKTIEAIKNTSKAP